MCWSRLGEVEAASARRAPAGAAARAAKLSPEQRSEITRNAARALWGKKPKGTNA